jgi:hypothetical protein
MTKRRLDLWPCPKRAPEPTSHEVSGHWLGRRHHSGRCGVGCPLAQASSGKFGTRAYRR